MIKAPKSESAKSNNRNRNRQFRLFDYEVYLSINNRQKNICSQRNKRVAGPCSPFFLYTTRLHQFTNTASRQLWLGTLINSEQLTRWSDDISLLNQEQGYKVPFFVDYCRLAHDISLFKQDHRYKVPFFVDYSTNNRNRQNRIIDKIIRIVNFFCQLFE